VIGVDRVEDGRLATAQHTLAPGLYEGRCAIVTGGGSGIGKAIAWLLARLGANVVICGRGLEKLELVRLSMEKAGLAVRTSTCDIRDAQAIRRLFDLATTEFGPLDLLVNNAGGQFAQAAIDMTPNGWRTVVDINLTGTWLMMQAAARHWAAEARGGAIVNIVAACSRGMPGIIHTSAARAGVINASRTAAVEWAPLGIRVNCVAPGLVDTKGLEVYSAEARAGFALANPQKTFGDPWDIAQVVAFLGGDATKFMTGATIEMDGGAAMWGELWTHGRPDYFSPSAAS
jgi:citronellol/citronellal dehydrogenase